MIALSFVVLDSWSVWELRTYEGRREESRQHRQCSPSQRSRYGPPESGRNHRISVVTLQRVMTIVYIRPMSQSKGNE